MKQDEIIGIALCHGENPVHLDILVTKPGEGAGPKLLKFISDRYSRLIAMVNVRHQRFYEKAGWKPLTRDLLEWIYKPTDRDKIE